MKVKARRSSMLAILAAAALLSIATVSRAFAPRNPVHSVTGSGVQFAGPTCNHVEIDAYQNADGTAYGKITWTSNAFRQYHHGGLQDTGWPWTIAVDTLLIDPTGFG